MWGLLPQWVLPERSRLYTSLTSVFLQGLSDDGAVRQLESLISPQAAQALQQLAGGRAQQQVCDKQYNTQPDIQASHSANHLL